MAKLQHNKKRNSMFLYEMLIKELTLAVIEGDSKKKVDLASLIKTHFRKGTALYEDWHLYRSLVGAKEEKEFALRLLQEAKLAHGTINQTQLFKEQSKLLKEVNTRFTHKVYSNFLPNYRSMVTVYQILHSKLDPKERLILEDRFINEISSKEEQNLVKELEPVNKLTFKLLVERFNMSYSDLLPEQKKLLENYVFSATSKNVEFLYFINEEVGRLKSILNENGKLEEDTELKEKLNEVSDMLNSYSKKEDMFGKETVEQLLKIQALANEMQANKENIL